MLLKHSKRKHTELPGHRALPIVTEHCMQPQSPQSVHLVAQVELVVRSLWQCPPSTCDGGGSSRMPSCWGWWGVVPLGSHALSSSSSSFWVAWLTMSSRGWQPQSGQPALGFTHYPTSTSSEDEWETPLALEAEDLGPNSSLLTAVGLGWVTPQLCTSGVLAVTWGAP